MSKLQDDNEISGNSLPMRRQLLNGSIQVPLLNSSGSFKTPSQGLRNSFPLSVDLNYLLQNTPIMAPVKKSKSAKSSESINSRLQLVVKSGKVKRSFPLDRYRVWCGADWGVVHAWVQAGFETASIWTGYVLAPFRIVVRKLRGLIVLHQYAFPDNALAPRLLASIPQPSSF